MGKGRKGGGGKGKQQRRGGGNNRKQKDDSPVVVKKKVAGKSFPVPGLMNLGNTCFFNSVMQSIGQTLYLRRSLDGLMTSSQYTLQLMAEEEQLQVKVTEPPGTLTKTLHTFIGEMATHPGSTLNPRPLFSQICDKAPRFRGFQQQDSQELLRYLLDSLKMEEVHRIKRAILVAFNISGGKSSKNQAINKLSDKDRELIKVFGTKAYQEHTYVDSVFGGSLVSTVTCSECHNCTTIHESYLDLSLSIPKDKVSLPSSGSRSHQLGNKRDKSHRNARTSKEKEERESEGEGEREREIDNPKAAASSKHQLKKARKKERKGKVVKRGFHELEQMLGGKEGVEKHVQDGSNVDECDQSQGRVEGVGEDGEQSRELETDPQLNLVQEDGCRTTCIDVDEVGDNVGEEGEREGEGESEGDREREREGERVRKTEREQEREGEEKRKRVGAKEDGESQLEAEALAASVESQLILSEHSSEGSAAVIGSAEVNVSSSADFSRAASQNLTEGAAVNLSSTPPPDGNESLTIANQSNTEGSGHVTLPCQLKESTPTTTETCSPLNSVDWPEDSIEGCLRKFCTLEQLTGSNRFLCSYCTERKRLENASSKEGNESQVVDLTDTTAESTGTNGSSLEPREGENSLKDGADDSREEEEASRQHNKVNVEKEEELMNDDRIESELQNGLDKSVADGDGDNRSVTDSREESFADEDMLDTSSASSQKAGTSSTGGKPVFCDATKQLLIKTLPLVLTLHLKRFLQDGRRCRKNGRHISFPALLDMAPYCVSDCKSLCDSCGRILYSLYGVVEHAGGMQGGHYTAYVRVRQMEDHTPPTSEGSVRRERCMATNGECTKDSTTDDQRETTVVDEATTDDQRETTVVDEATTDDQRETTVVDEATTDEQTETTVVDETTSMPNDDHITHNQAVGDHPMNPSDQPPTTADPNHTTSDQTTTKATQPTTTTTPLHTPTTAKISNPKTHEFDLSSTTSQWYHISDTRVRTATQNEVDKSQAYILFYERLPLKKSF